MRELPLKEVHQALGAKFVPFAGWNMPVQYSGISEEHNTVRSKIGIFDVSHMGELFVSGDDAVDFLNYVSTNNISRLVDGKAQYGLVLNHEGGVIDDIIVYRIQDKKYFVCVNASNITIIYEWFVKCAAEGDISKEQSARKPFSCFIENASERYAQFAIQGPDAMKLLASAFGDKASILKRFSFSVLDEYSKNDTPCILARTGYTGEDGCEIFAPKEFGAKIWKLFFEIASADESLTLLPCGLGARDTLRLEAGYPLHGHEIKEDITPLSAGLERFVSFDKGFFIGGPALEQQKQLGVSPVLIGLRVEGAGIIRADYPLQSAGKTVGWVCSGTKTPTIGKAIAMALVLPQFNENEISLSVKARDKDIPVKKIPLPFYKASK